MCLPKNGRMEPFKAGRTREEREAQRSELCEFYFTGDGDVSSNVPRSLWLFLQVEEPTESHQPLLPNKLVKPTLPMDIREEEEEEAPQLQLADPPPLVLQAPEAPTPVPAAMPLESVILCDSLSRVRTDFPLGRVRRPEQLRIPSHRTQGRSK